MVRFKFFSKFTARFTKSGEKASAAVGFLSFLQQGDDDGGGIISLVIDLVKYVGEYLAFVRASAGDPASVKDFILAKFEATAAQEIDNWVQQIVKGNYQEQSLLETVFLAGAVLAIGLIVGNFVFFVGRQVVNKLRSETGRIQSDDAKATGMHIARDTLLPQVVVTLMPPVVIATILTIRQQLSATVLAVYEPGSIGTSLSDLLFRMLQGSQIGWAAFALPALMLSAGLMILIGGGVVLWAVAAPIWGWITLGRHGGGKDLVVLLDTTYTSIKPLIVLALMVFVFLVGPGILQANILEWIPVAIGILLWTTVVSAIPLLMLLVAFPKLERRALATVYKVQHYIDPSTPYVPRQWFLDPEHKSPMEVTDVYRKGYDVGEKIVTGMVDAKTIGTTRYMRERIRDRLRKF